jgi:hypothetical protein
MSRGLDSLDARRRRSRPGVEAVADDRGHDLDGQVTLVLERLPEPTDPLQPGDVPGLGVVHRPGRAARRAGGVRPGDEDEAGAAVLEGEVGLPLGVADVRGVPQGVGQLRLVAQQVGVAPPQAAELGCRRAEAGEVADQVDDDPAAADLRVERLQEVARPRD